MLRLSEVTISYGDAIIINDVSIDVTKGEVVTILGANGAGKTTILKTIAGLVLPRSGTITFEDQDITAKQAHEIVDIGITLVPEGRQLFPLLTVRDNLMMGAYSPKARKYADASLKDILDLFPRLGERLDQLAGSLSGGEQQMVAIARGLMARPKLLMFDEPSLGLAPIMVKQMFETINKVVATGVTIVIVEQNVFHTLSIADRGYVLENGSVGLQGSGEELLKNSYIRRAYLGI